MYLPDSILILVTYAIGTQELHRWCDVAAARADWSQVLGVRIGLLEVRFRMSYVSRSRMQMAFVSSQALKLPDSSLKTRIHLRSTDVSLEGWVTLPDTLALLTLLTVYVPILSSRFYSLHTIIRPDSMASPRSKPSCTTGIT